LFLVLLHATISLALVELPHHARGGLAWQQQKHLLGDRGNAQESWFDQQLDHNDPSKGTFKQRYYVDDVYWTGPGAPVFFEIGGEGPAEAASGGFIRILAQQFGALMVALEHRFYGKSVPKGGLSLSNLPFLSSRQALADVADVIIFLQSTVTTNQSKFFTFGGSYSGALSAWFRLKYPHLTSGSLSSSGVVNAIFDFTAFDTQVYEAIGTPCSSYVQATTAAFENGVQNGDGGRLRSLFGMDPASSNGDFFYMMADSAAMADQYGSKIPFCTYMMKANLSNPNSLMETFANFTNSFWGKDFGGNCFYDTNCLKNTPSKWQPTSRAWRWQKCSELAYFQNAPMSNSLRSTKYVTMEYNSNQCKEIFGQVIPNTNAANQYYGGKEIAGTNIFFSDFSDDPWQRASVLKTNNPAEPFFLVRCDGCGHCRDFHAPLSTDPPNLTTERLLFVSFLTKWLSE